ncbi:DNA-binding protein [Pseudidiomarina sediminum]|uniref:DNA-binding protein n=2 Tax=Pseudidiomarina sediminum TaxID=431675 RepID=A0A432ZB27_9GAMM|nr:YheV family putative metal-binding protein [Pseudidiomarina sediminum]RUO75138.1 DNA-binding protein [Pseudidiomarina sediminum]
MARVRKRFIAGATCPACGAADTLQLLISENAAGEQQEQVQCVSCQHRFAERQQEETTQAAEAKPVDDAAIIGLFKPE